MSTGFRSDQLAVVSLSERLAPMVSFSDKAKRVIANDHRPHICVLVLLTMLAVGSSLTGNGKAEGRAQGKGIAYSVELKGVSTAPESTSSSRHFQTPRTSRHAWSSFAWTHRAEGWTSRGR